MVLVPPGILRQALVDVLTAAVCAVPGGRVDVIVGAGAPRKMVTFRAHAVVPALAQANRSCQENIAMAHQLLGMIGGELAEKLKPRVVVIDVMMPRVEGWDLLQRLRVHVALRDTPVIICSILPEEQLALAMGASAYLRKPVSQADFLDALNHEVDRPPQ